MVQEQEAEAREERLEREDMPVVAEGRRGL